MRELPGRARRAIEAAQSGLLAGGEGTAPGPAGEGHHVVDVPGLPQLHRRRGRVVVRLQLLHVGLQRRRQRGDPRRRHVRDLAAARLHVEVVEQHAQVGVVVRPRAEEIRPGVLERGAIGAVDHVLREEVVGALVLDLDHEGVVLGAVVGVVERRRHRIAVGRVRFAVRVGRHHRDELGDAGAERLVAGARRVAHEDALAAHARRAIRPGVQHHADHRVAVRAELDVGVQFRQVALVVDVQLELQRTGGREVVRADRRAVHAHAELEAGDLVRRQDVAQRERLEDRPGHALAGDRHRLERLRQRRRRPQRDARVAVDHHRRAGALVQRVERQVDRPRARARPTARPGAARRAPGGRTAGSGRRCSCASPPRRASCRRTAAASRRRRRPRPDRRARRTSWARSPASWSGRRPRSRAFAIDAVASAVGAANCCHAPIMSRARIARRRCG